LCCSKQGVGSDGSAGLMQTPPHKPSRCHSLLPRLLRPVKGHGAPPRCPAMLHSPYCTTTAGPTPPITRYKRGVQKKSGGGGGGPKTKRKYGARSTCNWGVDQYFSHPHHLESGSGFRTPRPKPGPSSHNPAPSRAAVLGPHGSALIKPTNHTHHLISAALATHLRPVGSAHYL
jgi:hypothetical protein